MSNYQEELNRIHNLCKFLAIFSNHAPNLLVHSNEYIFEKWNQFIKVKIDTTKKLIYTEKFTGDEMRLVVGDFIKHQNKWGYNDDNRKEIMRIYCLMYSYSRSIKYRYNYEVLIKAFNYYINDFILVNKYNTNGTHPNLIKQLTHFDNRNKNFSHKLERSSKLSEIIKNF